LHANDLPDEANVVRYIKPTMVFEDGSVDGSEFCLRAHRPDDTGVSVNWLECFGGLSKAQQLDEVRRLSRLTRRKSGRLAELNVGATKHYVRNELEGLRFIHAPLAAEGEYEADPSHSEIVGLPSGNSPQAALIGDMIAECIKAIHQAVQE
jgi:hypothetical protein